VCRGWLLASAGCSDIRLLYVAGHPASDKSFASWLGTNSWRLEALTLTSSYDSSDDSHDRVKVLDALADAATAAAAAGRPLQLRMLRVFKRRVKLSLISRLLPGLPNLRCLRVCIPGVGQPRNNQAAQAAVLQQGLAALKQATQLEELWLGGPRSGCFNWECVADLMPLSLKSLSWDTHQGGSGAYLPSLSHLVQLTSLRLRDWDLDSQCLEYLGASHPSLQQLELLGHAAHVRIPQQQRHLLVGCAQCDRIGRSTEGYSQLRAISASVLGFPRAGTRLMQLSQLSAVSVDADRLQRARPPLDLQAVVTTASSLSSLRRLDLKPQNEQWWRLLTPTGLSTLTQVTRLTVFCEVYTPLQHEQVAWAEEVGRMTQLRWLSVPTCLLEAGHAWLGGLQQLQVLALSSVGREGRSSWNWDLPSCETWLEGASLSWQSLPPRLLLLDISRLAPEQSALRLLRRLPGPLNDCRCEVVTGFDLDELGDTADQLAGLPQQLQQALLALNQGP
jgi:hypothetical protein